MRQAGTYTAYLHTETLRVVTPYVVLACLALVWALLIAFARFPALVRTCEQLSERAGSWKDLLRTPHFLLAVLAQFLYVGAQVGTWSYFIQCAKEYGHAPERTAGFLLAWTLGALVLAASSVLP